MIIAPAFSSALHTDREDPEVEVHPCQFQSEIGTVQYMLIIINNHAIRSRWISWLSLPDTYTYYSSYSYSGFDTVHSCLCPPGVCVVCILVCFKSTLMIISCSPPVLFCNLLTTYVLGPCKTLCRPPESQPPPRHQDPPPVISDLPASDG